MNFLKFLSLFLLIFSYSIVAQDQRVFEDNLLQQLTLEQMQNFPDGNFVNQSNILQNGNLNSGIVNQTYLGTSTDPNIAVIVQNGNSNFAEINQVGSGINTTIVQNGDNNSTNTDLAGTDIDGLVNQYGINNFVSEQFSGSNVDFSISQQGTNNLFIHSSSSLNSINFRIEQKGNGIKTIIR